MRITQDPQAYSEGFYPVGDPRGLAWTSGFIEGKAKPVRVVKQQSKGE